MALPPTLPMRTWVPAVPGSQLRVLALLWLTYAAYLGRLNVTFAMPDRNIHHEVPKTEMGMVAFFLRNYDIVQTTNGCLTDRVEASRMLVWGLTSWSSVVRTISHRFSPDYHGLGAGKLGTSYILGGMAVIVLARMERPRLFAAETTNCE